MTEVDTYFICATARSGSSLLIDLLESSGVAGRPQAYFRAADKASWAERWQLRETSYSAFVQAARGQCTSNGVFGAKVMLDTFEELVGELSRDGLPLTEAFGRMRLVYLSRRDTLAQAVSWLRAEQTGAWYIGGSGEISGLHPTGATPAFDRGRITELMGLIDEHNRSWRTWFTTAGIEPLEVTYEGLARDPVQTTDDILGFLGLPIEHQGLNARHHRQAGKLNEEWVVRYRSSPS